MTPEFLAAVIDTLLPGDEVLPSGANAGLVVTIHASTHRDVLDAIGAEAFVRGDAAARSRILTSVEQRMPDAFRALRPSSEAMPQRGAES